MEVAGIFLQPIIQVLHDKLISLAVSNYARQKGIHRQLKKLEEMLPDIHAVLVDAEDKQMTNEPVKSWMEDLNDLAYDLDDLLDDVATEALPLELTMAESKASTSTNTSTSTSTSISKVRKLIPTCCICFTPPSAVKLDHNMMSKVEEITARLQDIETRKSILDLKENGGGIGSNAVRERRETTSLVEKSDVYGRVQVKETIIEELLRDEVSVDKVSVIPIVGMGGIGKTTLAQLIYNDERLEGRFDLKAWVCVSDDFHAYVHRVTKAILEEVTSKPHDSMSLNMLQQKLKENLSGKKFLLVLDDVWNKKYEDWELLKRPFMVGAFGSKIIVTTRDRTIASTMTLSPAYPLKELSKDECLSLFAHHALERENFDAHPNLKGIGEEIVNKCKGLPLAVKTLAGLLRTERHQSRWVDVLNSKIWDLPEESNILPALRLSYYHLPSNLKQCFAYCATFPKDYEFDKDELVLLWMGVGLLQLSKEKNRMEDFGYKCFDDLLSRSFFQQSGGSKSRFVMHDLLNDLALHVAGKICFRLDKLEGYEQIEIPKRARHLSFIREKFEVHQKFRPFYKVRHLRTFLPLLGTGKSFLANKVLLDLFPKLQYLRALSLSGYAITELPDSISDLKHLRYLNLSATSINRLPESVTTLYNLQTLILRSCKNLCMFPPNIGNLINLRHLDIVDTVQLREMSSGIGRLTNLQTLSKFIVGKNNGPGLKELKKMKLLRGSISIMDLQNVMDLRDANEANLRVKLNLDELELSWSSEFNDFRNENLELDVLNKLQPHKNLGRLKIKFYGGTKFPSWIGDPSFSEMVNVTLEGCRKCRTLPPLGHLPMLKKLCIRGMHEVKNLGDELYGGRCSSGAPFASLEALIFEDMPTWEEWFSSISSGVEGAERQFPCLREFTIRCCPKLIRVSRLKLPSLHKLHVQECPEMVLKNIIDVTSLTSLEVENITGLSQLEESLLQSLVAVESLVIKKCNQLVALWQNGRGGVTQLVRLQRLSVSSCPQLVSFGEELDDDMLPCISLQKLDIDDCVNLEKLPNELNKLTSLTSLEIKGCSKLACFPKTGVPSTLRRLEIQNCNELKSLPEGISGLERLKIRHCPSLRSWPTKNKAGVPSTLKVLIITGCENLELVSETMMMLQQQQHQEFNNINVIMSSLERLIIWNWPNIGMLLRGCINNSNNFASLSALSIWCCDGLESLSFPERCLPNLRLLGVNNCVNLRSLLTTNQILQSLESLYISDCPALQSFPERGLSIPNLRLLLISGCANLSSLSFDQIQGLTSLESIAIYGCPCLESFPQGNGDLPPNLIKLTICRCGILKPLSEWGLHRLASLQEFEIEGGYPELVSFPPDDNEYCVLPTTLTNLRIKDLPNLESISGSGLQNLTSLQLLSIQNCPNLKSISSSSKGGGSGGGLQNLTTLQHLWIGNCPKLRYLPKEGLPSMLQSLEIRECPLLKERCLEDGGDYWPNIAHIPYVGIHGNYLSL